VITKTHFGVHELGRRGMQLLTVRWEPQTPSPSLRTELKSNLPGHRLGHLLLREWPIVGAQQIHAPNCGPPSRRKRRCWAQGEAVRNQVRCHRAEWSRANRPHLTSCCLSLQQTYFYVSKLSVRRKRHNIYKAFISLSWPGRESVHSPKFIAEACVKLYFHLPHVSMTWCLTRHKATGQCI
jgi:hypothetical protein